MSQAATQAQAVGEGKPTLLPGWRWVRLGKVCDINPRRPSGLKRREDAPTTFVPMSAVDERSGTILAPEIRTFAETRNGYTYFAEGDVLFAKITPCMQNGKHAIARNLIGGFGFGSTEFHVVRPGPQIISDWIFKFLRQPSVLRNAAAHFTGAVGQQRVPKEFLESLKIPLPPLVAQKRIAAILSERLASVERAQAAAEERLEATHALPSAYLRAIFNSPQVHQWPQKRLGQVCDITMGQSPEGASYNSNGIGVPLLNGPTEFGPVHPTPVKWTTAPTQFAEPGTILFCVRGATTGRMNLADRKYCIGRGLAAIRGREGCMDTDFLRSLLEMVTASLLRETAGSTFPNLPGKKLERFSVGVPPLPEQQRIAAILNEQMEAVERARNAVEEELKTIDALLAAILGQAFSGKLCPEVCHA